ncbi:MAG: tetratricopeptide repeat protein [Deltaproteobacteria bacterium]
MIKFLLVLFFYLCPSVCNLSFAQQNEQLTTLSKQVIEAKADSDLYPLFQQITDLYFKENKYSECAEFLNSLAAKKKTLGPYVNYFLALDRYRQLKYLEESQGWDEYFAKGNAYRDDITGCAQKVIDTTSVKEPLYLYARLILWQFHKDQQDAFLDGATTELMRAASEYSKDARDPAPIKKVADQMMSYGEKTKPRELYKMYVDKLISSQAPDQDLSGIAAAFYNEGNLDLAETVYDLYMGRASTQEKDKSVPVLIGIAKNFAYQDGVKNDPAYAEKVFKKIEEIGGKDSLNEELIYLRAFNLEKIKEYPQAKDVYADFLQRFPSSVKADEAIFKIGVISIYVLRDMQGGQDYLEKLAKKETLSPQGISALYQLALLNQWKGDAEKAKDYYNQLLESAGSDFPGVTALTAIRLKEIDQAQPIEYNLKMFLDASLKEDSPSFGPSKADMKASVYRPGKDESVNISATAYAGESGCTQVELSYLWSGDLGDATPSSGDSDFSIKYASAGTKVINLVVVSSAGILDRTLDFLDVK